jgi:hypothetical protein
MKDIFIKKRDANLIGLVSILPLAMLIIIPFWIKWGKQTRVSLKMIKNSLSIFDDKLLDILVIVFAPTVFIFIGIILHELIHGFFMVLFSKKGFKSVKFGIVKKHLIPYAHCKEPLISKKMLVVSLAPFFFLGLIPIIYAFETGSLSVWFMGFAMTLGSVGDFIYAYLILKSGLNHLILDHDSEVGFKIIT